MMYAHTDRQTDGQTHCCLHNIDRWFGQNGKLFSVQNWGSSCVNHRPTDKQTDRQTPAFII